MTTVHRLPRSGDIEGCSTPDVPAVFLDRDGTLTRDVRHSADPENLALLPGVGLALSVLHGAGYALVVVANQSGVARGCFTEAAARAMGERLGRLVAEAGARLDGYYFCPHAAMDVTDENGLACLCRKPAPGLLFRAAAELGLSLHRSWMVGDRVTDARAGWAAGCRSVLVDIGDESVAAGSPLPLVARNMPHAAKLML
ncbi:MAG: D-glycero-alpha-D-manno-heptose-1,7-bisphosphate 7-phosphatase, partial [Anaerolineae bacterium]